MLGMKAPLLADSVARDRRLWLTIYGLLGAAGVASIVAGVLKVIGRGNVIYAAPIALVGALGFLLTLLRKKNAALEALLHAPDTVVWIYPTVINGQRVSISVATVDGKLHGILLPADAKEGEAMAEATACAPNALVGYRSDWKDLFFASPSTFIAQAGAQGFFNATNSR